MFTCITTICVYSIPNFIMNSNVSKLQHTYEWNCLTVMPYTLNVFICHLFLYLFGFFFANFFFTSNNLYSFLFMYSLFNANDNVKQKENKLTETFFYEWTFFMHYIFQKCGVFSCQSLIFFFAWIYIDRHYYRLLNSEWLTIVLSQYRSISC